MGNTPRHKPYQTLGKHLRYLREQQRESLAEVSGAVEIDERSLERIEDGHERPPEEILLLLISHFDMQDQEAVQLWELAGYDGTTPVQARAEEILQDVTSGAKPVVVLVGMDSRIMYTDSVHVDADDAGVVMSFGQLNSKKQQQHISKLGMSYDQAEEVLRQLQAALLHGKYGRGPKSLPPSTPSSDDLI
jgi:transcriptional regulator with XRE-family HTH domain